jgi:hypothetical protein
MIYGVERVFYLCADGASFAAAVMIGVYNSKKSTH